MADVTELTAEEFANLRSHERLNVGDAIYILLRIQGAMLLYRGADRRTALTLVEHGGEYFQVIITLKVSERWVCDARDESQAALHLTRLTTKALGIL